MTFVAPRGQAVQLVVAQSLPSHPDRGSGLLLHLLVHRLAGRAALVEVVDLDEVRGLPEALLVPERVDVQ